MVLKPVDQLKQKVQVLEEENIQLAAANKVQLDDINKLKEEIEKLKALESKIAKEKQRCKEFEKKMKDMESDVAEAQKDSDREHENEIQSYKDKFARTSSEIGYLSKRLRNQEAENVKLKNETKEWKHRALAAETESSKQIKLAEKVEKELEELKLEQAKEKGPEDYPNPSFREFVKLKKEVKALKEENSKLRSSQQKSDKLVIQHLADS